MSTVSEHIADRQRKMSRIDIPEAIVAMIGIQRYLGFIRGGLCSIVKRKFTKAIITIAVIIVVFVVVRGMFIGWNGRGKQGRSPLGITILIGSGGCQQHFLFRSRQTGGRRFFASPLRRTLKNASCGLVSTNGRGIRRNFQQVRRRRGKDTQGCV